MVMKRIILMTVPGMFLMGMCWHMGYGPNRWEFYVTFLGSTVLEAMYMSYVLKDYKKNYPMDRDTYARYSGNHDDKSYKNYIKK